MASILILILSSLLLFLQISLAKASSYNCNRKGSECQNNGICDADLGTCKCVGSQFVGYDCSLYQQSIMQGQCLEMNPCLNGATCYDVSSPSQRGEAICYCAYGFYGRNCEIPTVQNICSHDSMEINVNPGRNFGGTVSIKLPAGYCQILTVNAQMEYSLNPARQMWEGYAAKLPFQGSMCGKPPHVNQTATGTTYTYEVLIRYNISLQATDSHLDEIITFSCDVPNQGSAPRPTAVLFTVTDDLGNFIQQPTLGEPFRVTFSLDPTSGFTDLSVQSCRVYNKMRTNSKEVVANGCPRYPFAKALVKQADTHVLTMLAHTFGSRDPSLDFDCDVKVCQVGDTSCQMQPSCPVPGPGQPPVKSPVAPLGASELSSILGLPQNTDLNSLLSNPQNSGAANMEIFKLMGGTGTVKNVWDALAAPPNGASGPAPPNPNPNATPVQNPSLPAAGSPSSSANLDLGQMLAGLSGGSQMMDIFGTGTGGGGGGRVGSNDLAALNSALFNPGGSAGSPGGFDASGQPAPNNPIPGSPQASYDAMAGGPQPPYDQSAGAPQPAYNPQAGGYQPPYEPTAGGPQPPTGPAQPLSDPTLGAPPPLYDPTLGAQPSPFDPTLGAVLDPTAGSLFSGPAMPYRKRREARRAAEAFWPGLVDIRDVSEYDEV